MVKKYLSTIITLLLIVVVTSGCEPTVTNDNDGTTSRYSENELYYLCVKTIAKELEVSSSELLWDDSFPGIDECIITGATDGGTAVLLPIKEDNKTLCVVCEVYNDGTCIISSVEQAE